MKVNNNSFKLSYLHLFISNYFNSGILLSVFSQNSSIRITPIKKTDKETYLALTLSLKKF